MLLCQAQLFLQRALFHFVVMVAQGSFRLAKFDGPRPLRKLERAERLRLEGAEPGEANQHARADRRPRLAHESRRLATVEHDVRPRGARSDEPCAYRGSVLHSGWSVR